MKKIIAFVVLGLVLSGCTANYEINIKNNKISEKLKVVETDTSLFDVENDSGWTLRESFEAILKNDEFSKNEYKIKSLNSDKQLGVQYSSNKFNSVINSSMLNQCYLNPIVNQDGNIIKVDTGDDFQCYDFYESLDSIEVVLKTNHKVISSNADIEENGKYVWNITKDGNKRIQFSYDRNDIKTNYIPYIIIIVIFIIILIILFYVKNQREKKDQI